MHYFKISLLLIIISLIQITDASIKSVAKKNVAKYENKQRKDFEERKSLIGRYVVNDYMQGTKEFEDTYKMTLAELTAEKAKVEVYIKKITSELKDIKNVTGEQYVKNKDRHVKAENKIIAKYQAMSDFVSSPDKSKLMEAIEIKLGDEENLISEYSREQLKFQMLKVAIYKAYKDLDKKLSEMEKNKGKVQTPEQKADDLYELRNYFGHLRESQAHFLYVASLSEFTQSTTQIEILKGGKEYNDKEKKEVEDIESGFENLLLVQHLRMHIYKNWKEERYNYEDSIGVPFMQFMIAVVAIVFFCVLLENFAIYSTNIKKEEKPAEFLNVEKLE